MFSDTEWVCKSDCERQEETLSVDVTETLRVVQNLWVNINDLNIMPTLPQVFITKLSEFPF